MGRTACKEPQCLYRGALYLFINLLEPSGPVQACTGIALPFFHFDDSFVTVDAKQQLRLIQPSLNALRTKHVQRLSLKRTSRKLVCAHPGSGRRYARPSAWLTVLKFRN